MPTYLVTNKATDEKVFVKAISKQAAVQAITTDKFIVEVASVDDTTALLPMGVKVIDTAAKSHTPPSNPPAGE